MAKRFTDTNKYKKPFIRGLKGAYKLFWDYLYHDCDHAGIWIVDFEIAQLYIGKDMPITKELALLYFNDKEKRIVEFDNGKKWFIPSFIEFQYGQLNPANRAHNSVISILEKNNLYKNKPLTSPLQEAMDMDIDMDMDKDKDKDKDNDKILQEFELFWNIYDKKVGNKKKLLNKWKKLKKPDKDKIFSTLPSYVASTEKKYRKNPETYLNNTSWNDEIIGDTFVPSTSFKGSHIKQTKQEFKEI